MAALDTGKDVDNVALYRYPVTALLVNCFSHGFVVPSFLGSGCMCLENVYSVAVFNSVVKDKI